MKNINDNKQTFSFGAAVMLFSTVFAKLISAFFKIPLSQDFCLGDLGFGYFSLAYDIYIPIYTLAASGFPVAISKIMSDYTAENKQDKALKAFCLYKRIMLTLGVLGFGLILVFAKPISSFSDNTGNSFYTMLSMAPAVFFCCVSSSYKGAIESKCNMTPAAISNLIEAFAKVMLGFISAFVTVKLTHNIVLASFMAMLGISVGTAISFIYLKLSYKRNYNEKINADKNNEKIVKKLLVISFPIVFSSFAISVISLIDALTVNVRLSNIIDNSYSTVLSTLKINDNVLVESLPTFLYGIRSKAYTIYHLVPTFVSALAISAVPVITSSYSGKDRNDTKANISTLLKFSSVITFPLGFGMIFAGKPVMHLLFGDNTSHCGGVLLTIYGFAALFSGVTVALTAVLQSTNRQNIGFINYFYGLILKLIFNIILIGMPNTNIYGAAISTVICYLFVMVADIFVLFRAKLIPPLKNTVLKPMISALICGIAAFLISSVKQSSFITVLSIFVAILVYFGLLFVLKAFEKNDFNGLPFRDKIIKILKLA